MRILATVAMLLAITAGAFGQNPNRNRMNEQVPEMPKQENLGRAPSDVPPANANRMNVEFAAAPASELAGGPNPMENRMNDEWAQPESKAQAEKPGKLKRR